MKKKLLAVVCLIMTFIMGLSCFSGCRLVTTDSEKDMQQVVATISIDSNVKDEIYKQDLIIAYLSYGYVYVQNYGYALEDVFEMLLDGLVNDRILVQNAMKTLSPEYGTTGANVYKVENYLTDDEKAEAEYDAIHGLTSTIESYIDEHAGHSHAGHIHGDTISGTVRTAPTNAAAKEEEVSLADKKEFVQKYKTEGLTSANAIPSDHEHEHEVAEIREAFNKAVNMFKSNNLLGDFDGKDLLTSGYYKAMEKQAYESTLLTKFRESKQNAVRSTVDFEDLQAEYLAILDEQKEWNNAEFVQALGSSSISKPVLFGLNGNYGYVYNILLGASDLQAAKIKEIDANLSIEEKANARREILEGTSIVDLRDTWILTGYDFDAETMAFTGDYTFAKDPANSLKFQGSVRLADGCHEGEEEYSAKSTVMNLPEFVEMMETYVYGDATLDYSEVESEGSYYKGAKYDGEVVEYKAKMQELLFAFSTDNGSLNNENGYLIKPPVDGANSEEYVQTFADAGRKLLEMGGKSYVIVASDYGYHVMFFSEVYSVGNAVADTLVEYLDTNFDLGEYSSWADYYTAMMSEWTEWEDTDNFLYILQDSLTNAKVSNQLSVYEKNVTNKYLYEEDGSVVINQKVFEEILNVQ